MSEWKRVKLGDCIKEINEKTTKNNQYEVLSVTKDGIFSQEKFFKKQIASENNIGYKIIRKNNLVFSTMNLWMGSLDVLTNYEIGIVSPAYKIFEFNKKLMLPEYGDYYMKSYYMLEQYKNCSEQGASVVRRNLDLKALLNVEINIPSIKEQEKIVGILKKIDDILKKIDNKNENIKRYCYYIMKKNLDKSDEMIKIRDVGTIVTGNTPKTSERDNYGEEYIWISPGDMRENKYINDSSKKLSKKGFEKARRIPKGSIVITCIGSTIGKIGIVEKECATNQQINSIILKENFSTEYVYYAIKYNFKYFKEYISNQAVPIINKSIFGNLQIPNKELKTQIHISRVLTKLDEDIEKNEKLKSQILNLKKALMQKLLTGKIRVKI